MIPSGQSKLSTLLAAFRTEVNAEVKAANEAGLQMFFPEEINVQLTYALVDEDYQLVQQSITTGQPVTRTESRETTDSDNATTSETTTGSESGSDVGSATQTQESSATDSEVSASFSSQGGQDTRETLQEFEPSSNLI